MRAAACRWFHYLSTTRVRLLQRVGSVGRRAVRPDAVTATMFSGHKLYLLPQDALDFHIYSYGVWEPVETAVFFESVWPGHDIVLDIGAHVGYYTLVAHAAGASRVISVEPSPENAGRLRYNLKLNGLSSDDVWEYALTREEGTVQLNIAGRDNTGKHSLAAVPNLAFTYPVQVKGISLAGFMARARIQRPDLVKVDIEGAEYDLLETGMPILTANPRLIMMLGVHPENLEHFGRTHEQVWQLLVDAGFETFTPGWPGHAGDVLRRLDRPPATRRPYTLLLMRRELANENGFLGAYQARIRQRLDEIAPTRARGRGVEV